MLKACVNLSERLKNEYPGEVAAISLNAILQSALSINSKELLHPASDLLGQLKEKIEYNSEIVAIECLLKVIQGKYLEKEERKIEKVEEISTIRDVEKKFVELTNKHINKEILENIEFAYRNKKDLKNTGIFLGKTMLGNFELNIPETTIRNYPEINSENIVDTILAYSIGQSIKCNSQEEWFSFDNFFEEIELKEIVEYKNFKKSISIDKILGETLLFLNKVIKTQGECEDLEGIFDDFNEITKEEVRSLLLKGKCENLQRMKDIYKEYSSLFKIIEKNKLNFS